MKLWVSSYIKKIYQININMKCTRIKEIREINLKSYPSYLCKYNYKLAVALKGNENGEGSGIIILNKKLEKTFELYNGISYTHIYMDDKYILAGSYHQGEILIIDKNNKLIKAEKFEKSKIHNVGKINYNKYYAVDLENQKVYIFKIENGNYEKIDVINVANNKPRHLVIKGIYMYVLCEDTSNILCYKKNKNKYIEYQKINTVNNSSKNEFAAIKIKNNILYTTNRGDNSINIYNIGKDGILNKYNCIDSFGKNPRDILPIRKRLIGIVNKDSNNLTIFCIKNRLVKVINRIQLQKPVCLIK